MSANRELMDSLHRALAEGLMTEFTQAANAEMSPNAALFNSSRADGSHSGSRAAQWDISAWARTGASASASPSTTCSLFEDD